MKVEIYSDVVCPWCYIGEKRFERALEAFPGRDEVEVVFRPFQLQPDAPTTAAPLRGELAKRFGAGVDRMLSRVSKVASEEGIRIDWDNALSANTLTAHRVIRLAEREYGVEVQRELVDALFDAHFTNGADVGDHEVLVGLAVKAGMDEQHVRAYLASDEGLEDVKREIDSARFNGITAVPTFIFDDKYIVEGGQPASTFLQVLEEVRRRSVSETTATAEACVDDACAVPAV
jgi:predicted DsbA family dithiol-disulfide isomerase